LWNIDGATWENIQFHALTGKPQVFLLTTSFLGQGFPPFESALEWLNKRGMDVYLVGRAASSETTEALRIQRRLVVGGPGFPLRGIVNQTDDVDWLLHSDPKDLFAWIGGDFGQRLETVRLFHNFPKRVQKLVPRQIHGNVAPLTDEEKVDLGVFE
jgi:hypothetical protein